MTDIAIHCKHCGEEIESSTIDQAYRWLHIETGNAFCDVHGTLDAVVNRDLDDRTMAEPDPDALYTDAVAALDEHYTLNYTDYRAEFHPDQIQVLLDGENPYESKEFSYWEDAMDDERYRSAREVIDGLLSEEAVEILESPPARWAAFTGGGTRIPNAGDLLDDLRNEIQDRDDSSPLTEYLGNSGSTLYRYDLDVAVPSPMGWDNDQRHETYREIAEAAGLNVLDRDIIRKLHTLTENASYGGHLYVIWYESACEAVKLAEPTHWKDSDKGPVEDLDPNGTVTFDGAYLIILDHFNGSGMDVKFDTITAEWAPRRVSIDAQGVGPGYSWHEIAGPSASAYDGTFTVHLDRQPTTEKSAAA